MPTIHELLEETKKRSEALVKEIETFKSARELNQRATEALESTCEALKATTKEIAPMAELRVRQMVSFIKISMVLNFLMFLIMLFIILFK